MMLMVAMHGDGTACDDDGGGGGGGVLVRMLMMDDDGDMYLVDNEQKR